MRRKTRFVGVVQLGPTTYEIRTRVYDAATKKLRGLRRIVEADSIEGAAAALLDLRKELQDSPAPPVPLRLPPRPTLSDYGRSWLKRKLAKGMRPSTRSQVAQVLEQVVLPSFGSMRVDEIRKLDIETWLAAATQRKGRYGRRPAPETVNGWLRVLKTLLRDAVSDLELDHDPTLRVEALPAEPTRVTDERPNALTADEVRRFLDVAATDTPDVFAMCVIGFFTGMRFGEISALTWNDIREDERVIAIRRSQWRGHPSASPKTGKTRSAALHPIILDAIKAQRAWLLERQLPAIGPALVFPSGTGGYHVQSYLEKPFARILKAAKIEKHLSAHGMRRTFNDLAREAQVNRVVLHATIGHSSDRMTQHYSHVRAEEKMAAVEQIVKVVKPAGVDRSGRSGGGGTIT